MRGYTLRFLIAVGLILGLMAGSLTAGANTVGEGDCLYFPWVPNGVEIDDPVTSETAGPFHGSITIQNLENEALTVYVMSAGLEDHHHCDSDLMGGKYSFSLDPFEMRTLGAFAYSNFIAEGFGGGLVVTGRKQSDFTEIARIAGVQRQSSPEPGAAGTGRTGSQHETVSGYSALTSNGINGQVHLPIVQTNPNWNTLIRATNFGTAGAANMHITLHESGGGGTLGPYFQITDPGETATFDLRALGVPDGWIGAATVTGGVPIAAVAERVKVETNMLLMNVSRAPVHLSDEVFAPLIFRDWFHWNTGVSISNPNGVPNEVEYTFFDMDGNDIHSDTITIPAHGMDFIYMPAGDGSPFVGSAYFDGDLPFHGAVDEVKYLGDDGDTGHAMSYSLNHRATEFGEALALPLAWKPSFEPPIVGETTGIQLFNPWPPSTNVEVRFYNADGSPALLAPLLISLDGWASHTIYLLDIEELSDGFRGSVVIRNIGLSGEGLFIPNGRVIVAVSNLVNYDVQYDGSSTFTLLEFSPPKEQIVCGGEC